MENNNGQDQGANTELRIPHSVPSFSEIPQAGDQLFDRWVTGRGGYRRLPDSLLRKLYISYPPEVKAQAEQELRRRKLLDSSGQFIEYKPSDVVEPAAVATETQTPVNSIEPLPESGTIIVPHESVSTGESPPPPRAENT